MANSSMTGFRSLGDYPLLPMSAATLRHEKRFAFVVMLAAIVIGLGVGILFIARPQLDLELTNLLIEDGSFVLRGDDTWSFIRTATMWAYALVYVIMIIALARSTLQKKPVWTLYPPQWFYLVACSLAGPLFVTNLVLKTYVGRPRPRSVLEYGGELDFTPVFEAGGKCADNCSFVSGEVSSMVMIFAALMFASRKLRWLFTALLVPAWAFSAYMRVGQGGHFPSDTFFAGIFMIVIAAGLYRLIVLSPRNLEVTGQ